jgi:hypothetical protein
VPEENYLALSKINGLAQRSFPDATFEFLRCQYGKMVRQNRRVRFLSTHGRFVETTMEVELFLLLGFGPDWETAGAMVAARNGATPPARAPVELLFGNN